MLFHNNPIVKTENVEVGYVSQYDDNGKGYKYFRKIIYARNTRNLLISNKQWENTTIQNIPTGEYEDVQGEMNYGIDLCEKVDGKDIKYLIVCPNANINDGDIIIIKSIKVGSFLRILGFPEYLTQKELNYAKSILLDSSYPIKTIEASISLSELEKVDLLEVKETIEKLKFLKSDGITSDVTTTEKEIFKDKSKSKKSKYKSKNLVSYS